MKFRIQANNIRIRLGRTETVALAAGATISQTTRFSPTDYLTTSIQASPTANSPSATFNASSISVVLPRNETRRWAQSAEVAIEAVQMIDKQQSLSILIEKDFECLHDPREANVDAFPNPGRAALG